MRGCDNSKIHISSNFIFSICLLIMFITLQHLDTLNHTIPNYTSLHLSTLHFLSFTLHYPLIWLNPLTFPTALFHLTSLNQTQYSSPIPKLISKIMHLFTVLKNRSPFHFISVIVSKWTAHYNIQIASLELPATYIEQMSTRASLSIPTPQKAAYGPILTFNVN